MSGCCSASIIETGRIHLSQIRTVWLLTMGNFLITLFSYYIMCHWELKCLSSVCPRCIISRHFFTRDLLVSTLWVHIVFIMCYISCTLSLKQWLHTREHRCLMKCHCQPCVWGKPQPAGGVSEPFISLPSLSSNLRKQDMTESTALKCWPALSWGFIVSRWE